MDWPLSHLDNEVVKDFMTTFTQFESKSDKRAREKTVPLVFNKTIEEIRQSVHGGSGYICFSIDGTSDINGKYACNFVIGNPENVGQRHILNVDYADSKAAVDLHKFFVLSMAIFFGIEFTDEYEKGKLNLPVH